MAEKEQSIAKGINKKYLIVAVAAAAVMLAVILIAAIGNKADEPEINAWIGNDLTRDVPEFRTEADDVIAADGSVAAFYSGVTSEEIAAYIQKLNAECGVDLSGDIYPRSAIYGEKIIVLHYNVTEREFSVTVANQIKGDND